MEPDALVRTTFVQLPGLGVLSRIVVPAGGAVPGGANDDVDARLQLSQRWLAGGLDTRLIDVSAPLILLTPAARRHCPIHLPWTSTACGSAYSASSCSFLMSAPL